MSELSVHPLDHSALRNTLARRLYRRSVVTGQITLPAAPGMLDEYVSMCDKLFVTVGRPFTDEQLNRLREVLAGQLDEAFTASPRSSIVISYEAQTRSGLNYHVQAEWSTLEGAHEDWVATREPPLFGAEPDARVWSLARELQQAQACRVLDVGAGTGRNALALGRRGHPVDVVELTPKLADIIRQKAADEGLDVRVIQRDAFSTHDDLRRDYELIALSEVVSDFRTTDELRSVFELAAHCLSAGGRLVFNAFVTRDGYQPDAAARELGQQTYTSIFTPHEIFTAAAGLALDLVSDESVYEYEKATMSAHAWPPTSWYADWVRGLDLFDVAPQDCPIEMRWLVYQKM